MAEAFVGARKQIALAKETVRGTKASPASGKWLAHEGFEFSPKIQKVENTSGSGSIVGRNQAHIIQEWSEGTIPLILSEENAGDILNLVFGAAPNTTGSSTYTHAYTLANENDHVTYTVAVVDPVAGSFSHARGMLNTATFEMSPDQYVKVGLDMIAGKQTTESAYTPAYSTTDVLFRPSTIAVKFAANYAGLGAAAAITTISNITLNFNKNAVPVWRLGSTEVEDIVNQRITINGDISFKYDVTTFRALGLAETSNAMQIVLTNSTHSLTIELPSADFQDWSHEVDNDGYMVQTLGFNANYLDKTNGFVKGSLVNGISSY